MTPDSAGKTALGSAGKPVLGSSGEARQRDGATPSGRADRKAHLLCVDLVRVLTIALVIGVHTISTGSPPNVFAAGALVTVLHVSREVFFLLTAFVLTYGYGTRPTIDWPRFWYRRYLFVGVPYLVWSAIYFVANGGPFTPIVPSLERFGHELIHGTTRYHMYFLLVSMQLYLVFPLLRRLLIATRRHHRSLFAVAVIFQCLVYTAVRVHLSPGGPLDVWLRGPNPWLPSYLGFVVAGAIAAWHLDELIGWTNRHRALITLATAAITVLSVGVYAEHVLVSGESTTVASAVFQPVVVLESFAVAWMFLAAGLFWSDHGQRLRRVVLTTSDASFGVYLSHPLLLQAASYLATVSGLMAISRRSGYGIALVLMVIVVVPLIYAAAVLLSAAARRTVASLALTGRPKLSHRPGERSRGWSRRLPAVTVALALAAGATTGVVNGASTTDPTPTTVTAVPPHGATASVHTISVDGLSRSYVRYAPDHPTTANPPILMVLHGVNATVQSEADRDGLLPLVSQGDAVLIYPVGFDESWNAGSCCGRAAKDHIDDAGFLHALAAEVDPRRRVPMELAGYSNGGRMVYAMACDHPTDFDGFAVVNAVPDETCGHPRAVTVLQVDGTADPDVPYLPGDPGKESPPATVESAALRRQDSCPDTATSSTKGTLSLSVWTDCADGTRVGFATYHGGTHDWQPGTAATPGAATVIWNFLHGGHTTL